MSESDFAQSGLTVSVVGATGLIGQAILDDLLGWIKVKSVMLFASAKRSGDTLQVGDREIQLHSLPELDGDTQATAEVFGDSDVVIFAVSRVLAMPWIDACAEDGLAIIDFSGAASAITQAVVPGVHTSETISESFAATRVLSFPSAPSVVLSQLLHPLRQLSAWAATATVQLSASSFGNAGLSELSAQVASVYNAKDARQHIFPEGLAFDVLSTIGQIDEAGFSTAERLIQLECDAALGGFPVQSHLQVLPLFSGAQVLLCAAFEEHQTPDQVRDFLSENPCLRISERPISPKNVTGRATVSVGRIRESQLPAGISLVASYDNISILMDCCHQALNILQEGELL